MKKNIGTHCQMNNESIRQERNLWERQRAWIMMFYLNSSIWSRIFYAPILVCVLVKKSKLEQKFFHVFTTASAFFEYVSRAFSLDRVSWISSFAWSLFCPSAHKNVFKKKKKLKPSVTAPHIFIVNISRTHLNISILCNIKMILNIKI